MAKTRMVNIRDFRANLTKFLKECQEKNVHFVVMRHSIPVAKVEPLDEDYISDGFAAEIAEARKQVKEG